jgi:hypothetical protein
MGITGARWSPSSWIQLRPFERLPRRLADGNAGALTASALDAPHDRHACRKACRATPRRNASARTAQAEQARFSLTSPWAPSSGSGLEPAFTVAGLVWRGRRRPQSSGGRMKGHPTRIAAAVLLLLGSRPAAAVLPPANDDCGSATVVAALPFDEAVNIASAHSSRRLRIRPWWLPPADGSGTL